MIQTSPLPVQPMMRSRQGAKKKTDVRYISSQAGLTERQEEKLNNRVSPFST